MDIRAFIFLGLLFASVLIASEVSGGELAETVQIEADETSGVRQQDRSWGGGYGGGGRPYGRGGYGGRYGGGRCGSYGCCGGGGYGYGCRCCASAAEAEAYAAAQAKAKPQN